MTQSLKLFFCGIKQRTEKNNYFCFASGLLIQCTREMSIHGDLNGYKWMILKIVPIKVKLKTTIYYVCVSPHSQAIMQSEPISKNEGKYPIEIRIVSIIDNFDLCARQFKIAMKMNDFDKIQWSVSLYLPYFRRTCMMSCDQLIM